jgi:phage terminase large subunit-like protein
VSDGFADVAERYARGVCDGRIAACREVRQACSRHLRDLARQGADDFPFVLDSDAAEKACAFIELLPHTKGEWGDRGECLRLEPWQVFIVVSIFGWRNQATGRRRCREAYLEIPRKNAKSTLAAAIGLYCFVADGEFGAEVYSGATTEKQAWEIFRPARLMALQTPELCEAFGIEVGAKNLSATESASRFEPLIGKPGDGASPSCALIDEYHEHQTPDLYETMRTGTGARRQPLILIVTTAGFDTSGPCYQYRAMVKDMLADTVPNESMFGVIYTIDDDDDWQSPEVLRKANPNFGVSVYEEGLLLQQKQATRYTKDQTAFLTKHLNRWITARSAWINLADWKACARPGMEMETFRGSEAFVGVDLASKSDITAVAILLREPFAEDGGDKVITRFRWRSFVRSYLPEAAIERAGANRSKYETWRRSGHLTVTDGDETNFDFIRDEIMALTKVVRVAEVAFDPWRAPHLAQQLAAEGATVTEVRNSVANFSPAMREMEAAIGAGRWEHPDDPCLSWMVSNVTAREDANRNLFPRKDREEAKIDGAVAILMALSRGLVYEAPRVSIYETRGVMSF